MDPVELTVLRVESPDNPIVRGVNDFALPDTEIFGVPFDIPTQTRLSSTALPQGGDFQSYVMFTFDFGRGLYIHQGTETFRISPDCIVCRVVQNATLWAACVE